MKKIPKLRFNGFSGEWEEKTMKNVANGFEYGMNAAAKKFDGENKYIRITDIDENTNRYNHSNIVSPDAELDEKYLVGENDILFTRTGASTGKTYIYNQNDGKLYFAGFLIRAKVNKDNDAKFVFLQTITRKYNNWVKIMSMRSGQPGLNAKEYASYSFNSPSKEEQQKISSFFSLIDKKLEKQQKKVEALKEYKKGMMQKIFSQEVRFKGFSGEWKPFNFKNLFKEVKQKTSDTKKYNLYSLTIENGVIPKSERYEREFLVSKDEENYKVVHSNEYVYNPMNLRFGALARYTGNHSVSVSGYYNVFKTIDNQAYGFLDNFLKTPRMMYIYNSIATGSLIEKRRVHFSQFIELSLPMPTKAEQQKISSFFSLLDQKLEKEQQKLNLLNQHKKGLLQQMFV